MKKFFRPLGAAVLIASALSLYAEPSLVGNKALNGQKLDGDGVKAVLLGKRVSLGSERVVLVIVKGSEAQEAFLKDSIAMTTDQFQTYWRRLYMTGGGSAPKVAATEEEALKILTDNPGAIAIIDSAKAAGLAVLSGK